MRKARAIAPIDDSKHTIDILNDMISRLRFHGRNTEQNISHVDRLGNEYLVYFIRKHHILMFSFDGFGDLFGYYSYLKSSNQIICESNIGINDDLNFYWPSPLSKAIKLTISKNPEPRNF